MTLQRSRTTEGHRITLKEGSRRILVGNDPQASALESSVARDDCACDVSPVSLPEAVTPNPFWNEFRGIVWSNSKASDSFWIRASLLRPQFGVLLRIAQEFGIERVWKEWRVLEADSEDTQAQRARSAVERILTNIEIGFQRRAVA